MLGQPEHAAQPRKEAEPVGIAIIRGATGKPAASDMLCTAVEKWARDRPAVSGKLYVGYPVERQPR